MRNVAIAKLSLASKLARCESNEERQKKKERVIELIRKELVEAFPELLHGLPINHLRLPNWSQGKQVEFLINLLFIDPFAPYELRSSEKVYEGELLRFIGEVTNLPDATITQVFNTRKKASECHKTPFWTWDKIAIGAGTAAAGVALPFFGAPALIAVLGGTSSTALTATLAALGGGSIAAGGGGMLAGIGTISALAGGVGIAAGSQIKAGQYGNTTQGDTKLDDMVKNFSPLLYGNPLNMIQILIRNEVVFREVILYSQQDVSKASKIIEGFKQVITQSQSQLEEEMSLNDKDSTRVKNLEEVIKAMHKSQEWMQKEFDHSR